MSVSWHLYEINLDVKYGEYAGGGVCDISESLRCDVAAKSDYSSFLGIPIAAWGFCYYLFLFFAGAFYSLTSAKTREALSALITWLVVSSIFYSVFLFFISEYVLKSLCPFCLGLYVINILSFLLLPKVLGAPGFIQLLWMSLKKTRLMLSSWPTLVLVFVLIGGWWTFRSHTLEWARNYKGERLPVMVDAGRDKGKMQSQKEKLVQIILFSDFECPYCERAHVALVKLEKEFVKEVDVTYLHYPLDSDCNQAFSRRLHPNACHAALIAEGAREQGKFDEVSTVLFSLLSKDKSSRTKEDYDRIAATTSLDLESLYKYIEGPEALAAIRSDVEKASQYGVSKTPTIFINGRKIVGFPGIDALRTIIQTELERVKSGEKPETFIQTPTPLESVFGDCLG